MQKKAGTGGGAAPAAALLVWYAAVLALAYVQYSGLLLGLAMLGCYILILRSLFRLSREMEESGYALTPAPVRLSDETLVRAIAALLAVGIACGYLFFGSYRMDWQPKSGSLSAEAVEIRAQVAFAAEAVRVGRDVHSLGPRLVGRAEPPIPVLLLHSVC